MADEARIRQVIDNLLANVRAHTPRGTSTVLTVSEDGDEAVIEVADSGPGLPTRTPRTGCSTASTVVTRSRSRDSGGSGLGLAIVRAIVLKHGGTVSAANAPGARSGVHGPTPARPVRSEPGLGALASSSTNQGGVWPQPA